MKVVLAEEDVGMRAFIRSLLAEHVATVVEVATSHDCLAITGATAPDVVLLGAVDMRDESGRDLPSRLRRASPRSRLLVLGARPPAGSSEPMPDVAAFLPYPFGTQHLLQQMHPSAARLPS